MNLKVIVHEAEEGGKCPGRDPKRSEFGCSSCWWKKVAVGKTIVNYIALSILKIKNSMT